MKQIRNTRQLRKAISEGERHYKLILQFGLFSLKTIRQLPDRRFTVVNHIDGTREKLTARELYSKSNIGKAMRLGALVASR